MSDRPSTWYAYFRFYIDETTIIDGLNSYCVAWETMTIVGYNYREYRCSPDNLGGFEHWVGDMGGYISQVRETGFIDGAPSDGVVNHTLLMGAVRVISKRVAHLAGFGVDAVCYIRKITATDSGISHKVNFKISKYQKIVHPVMYTLDSSQIELIKISSTDIEDNSDVDEYELQADVDRGFDSVVGTVLSNPGVTITDLDKMWDGDDDTHCTMSGYVSAADTYYVIIDLGYEHSSVGLYWYQNTRIAMYLYVSEDNVAWTQIGSAVAAVGFQAVGNPDIKFRYIKLYFYNDGAAYPFESDISMLITR